MGSWMIVNWSPRAMQLAQFASGGAVALALIVMCGLSLAQDEGKAFPRANQGHTGATHVGPGDMYAVVVGVSRYKNPGIPQLKVSDKDATDFAAFLKTQNKLFKKVHVALLLNEKATQPEVTKHLYYNLKNAEKNDTVIIFLSGHGADDPKAPGEFFFLTHDADLENLAGTAVHMSRQWFTQRLESKRMVLIADACHAGGFPNRDSKAIRRSFDNLAELFREAEGKVWVTSSRADERSLENPKVGNSLFTYFLIEGLKGAAAHGPDGVITLDAVYDYVYRKTREASNNTQSPQKEGKVVGPFPMALSSRHTGAAVPPVTSEGTQHGLSRPPEPQDDLTRLLNRAAEGDAEARFELGLKYEHGAGVPEDKDVAQRFYAQAAEAGHQKAKLALARLSSPSSTGLSGSGGAVLCCGRSLKVSKERSADSCTKAGGKVVKDAKDCTPPITSAGYRGVYVICCRSGKASATPGADSCTKAGGKVVKDAKDCK